MVMLREREGRWEACVRPVMVVVDVVERRPGWLSQ